MAQTDTAPTHSRNVSRKAAYDMLREMIERRHDRDLADLASGIGTEHAEMRGHLHTGLEILRERRLAALDAASSPLVDTTGLLDVRFSESRRSIALDFATADEATSWCARHIPPPSLVIGGEEPEDG